MAQNEGALTPAPPRERAPLDEPLRWTARSIALLAVLSSFALLYVGAMPLLGSVSTHFAGAAPRRWTLLVGPALSGLPLLLTGVAYMIMQAIVRPRPLELLKRLMLAFAFLLWGVVQLMPESNVATELGNLVIALYVIDLGLIMWTELHKRVVARHAESDPDLDAAL